MRIFFFVLFLLLSFSVAQAAENMNITSPSFIHNGDIPQKFTCQGEGVSPQLEISAIPPKAKSLALIVDDPDAPMGTWVHWVVFNIDPKEKSIKENSVPGMQGRNGSGDKFWGPPCPPSGVHRYFFKVYALDILLPIKEGAKKTALEEAMAGHVLDKAELIGLYRKQ